MGAAAQRRHRTAPLDPDIWRLTTHLVDAGILAQIERDPAAPKGTTTVLWVIGRQTCCWHRWSDHLSLDRLSKLSGVPRTKLPPIRRYLTTIGLAHTEAGSKSKAGARVTLTIPEAESNAPRELTMQTRMDEVLEATPPAPTPSTNEPPPTTIDEATKTALTTLGRNPTVALQHWSSNIQMLLDSNDDVPPERLAAILTEAAAITADTDDVRSPIRHWLGTARNLCTKERARRQTDATEGNLSAAFDESYQRSGPIWQAALNDLRAELGPAHKTWLSKTHSTEDGPRITLHCPDAHTGSWLAARLMPAITNTVHLAGHPDAEITATWPDQ